MKHFPRAIRRWCFFAAMPVLLPLAAMALNICVVCNQEITGSVYIGTDLLTSAKSLLCSNCMMLTRCFICGMPVKTNAPVVLPDGRELCERDAKSVVLDADAGKRICARINDDLNRQFSRFTAFPSDVAVEVIDRVDAMALFHQTGFDFESPNLLGCIRPATNFAGSRYWMQLMTGQTPTGLKATCAHEFAHAWAGDNVPPARRARIARSAEEGFCEMVAWLVMDAQHEEEQKKIILRNLYTRGQVDLFIEAEQRFGFDQVLDWMKYGDTARLESGHVEKIRNVTMPAAKPAAVGFVHAVTNQGALKTNPVAAVLVPVAMLKLEGIDWGAKPLAIVNGHTFAPGETAKVKLGAGSMVIRCVAIEKNSVRIRETESATEYLLRLP